MKCCKKCGVEKSETEFRANKSGGRRNECRECERIGRTAWYATHKDKCAAASRKWCREHLEQHRETKRKWCKKNPAKHRANRRQSRYGLTQGDFETLYKLQTGKCAICSDLIIDGSGRGGLAIDHCHLSGKVRGLLCAPCNKGLGHFRDDAPLLKRAAEYLEKNH